MGNGDENENEKATPQHHNLCLSRSSASNNRPDTSIIPERTMATLPNILRKAKFGPPSELELLLREGENPNTDDDYDGTCIMASACYAQPECARLLIDYGADVTYAYPGDNASVLYMLALCFQGTRNDLEVYRDFGDGDYLLTADILINAGAPIDTKNWENGQTALSILQEMQVTPGTKKGRERDGLISLLTGSYWRGYDNGNPFLHASSAKEVLWLLEKGAANGGDDGSVDCTRVRSIRPKLRLPVLLALVKHQATCAAFEHLLTAVQDRTNSTSPICVFQGMQDSILMTVAAFAGVSGKACENGQEAARILEDMLLEDEEGETNYSEDTEEMNSEEETDGSDSEEIHMEEETEE